MISAELLNHLQTMVNQLVELPEYQDYQRLCDQAKKAGNPTVADALDAVLHAIRNCDRMVIC